MAPITTASNDETHFALLDKLDMYKIHKPFRNPAWHPPMRRNKNLRQILSEVQRREQQALQQLQQQQSLLNTQNNSGANTPQPTASLNGDETPAIATNPQQGSNDLSRAVLEKSLANATLDEEVGTPSQEPAVAPTIQQPSYTWTSIAAAPSFRPKQKYCDVTGLPAPYIDPKSGLRYASKEIYGVIRTLGTAAVQELLAARGANTVLK